MIEGGGMKKTKTKITSPGNQIYLLNKKWTVFVLAPGFKPAKNVCDELKKLPAHYNWNPKRVSGHFLMASSKNNRISDLVFALTSHDIDVIWCVRGGYGSLDLVETLSSIPIPKKPKILIGLSDVTSLHIVLNAKWGWTSLHASNIDRCLNGLIRRRDFRDIDGILNATKPVTIIKGIKPINKLAERSNELIGPLMGGNLVTLSSHLGTGFDYVLPNSILFLEEIGERAYRIYRLLTQLKMSGYLKSVRGVVFGEFYQCLEPDGKTLWQKAIKEWASDLTIPVWSGVPCGHGQKQVPLCFGSSARLIRSGNQFALEIQNALKK